MDRQAAINNINQRYISNVIAGSLANNATPINSFQPYPNNNQFSFSPPIPDTQLRDTPALPISISEAQRQLSSPFATQALQINPHMGHDSRMGQIIYDETAGTTQRAKSRMKSLRAPPQQSAGLLPWLLPGIITFLLLVFVIVCIVKHRSKPLSQQSFRYYSQNSEYINNPLISETSQNKPYNNQHIQPSFNNPQPYKMPNFQDSARQQNIENSDLMSPQSNGECREGYYLLNGVCYYCKNGYWNGTKCITKNLGSNLFSNQFDNPQTTTNTFSTTTVNTSRVSTAGLSHPNIQSPQCLNGGVLVNGRCVSCPSDSIWNGHICQKVNVNSHLIGLMDYDLKGGI